MTTNRQTSDQMSEKLLRRRRGTLVEAFGFLLGPQRPGAKRQGWYRFGPIPPGGGLARYGLLLITSN